MAKIFLSYRRDDSAGYVRAVRSDIKHRFGGQHVFLDVEDIEAGSDFVGVIEREIGQCDAVLAFIGPSWLNLTNHSGQRRLDDPGDFVRREIATALRSNIRVLPVLVGDQPMPAEASLPDDLKPLARLQAVALSDEGWDDDINRLYRALDRATDELKLSRQYLDAEALLHEGRWQEALSALEQIELVRPNFRDVAEQLTPLRELAAATADLGPARGGWQRAVYRFPVLAMLCVGAIPNGMAALFNFHYNWHAIVVPMQARGLVQAESLFKAAAVLVNSAGFAVGFGLFAYLARPAARVLKALGEGLAVPQPELEATRVRCLKLGHYAALIGIALWVLFGPVYPVTIGTMAVGDYAFFIVSLALCGVIAGTYPFLGVTWLCVRVLLLPMIPPASATAADLATLERVEQWNWRYLLLAGMVPMLAITLAVMLGPKAASVEQTLLLGALGLGGVGGFAIAIGLSRWIQRDLAVLKQVISRAMPQQRRER